jgi:dTDP-4-dehydrorhamnose reductase
LAATVRAVRPNVIVNAAAYTAVDKAESEPEIAQAVNALSAGVLAEQAKLCGALLVHYSSDYVFDGSGVDARNEEAVTGPLSVYGHSKLNGEALIRSSGCRHFIFRTSWVYAARGGNFAKTMLRLASERDELKVIANQVGAPTGADLLADVTALAIRKAMVDAGAGGTFNLVAAGETSWHEYASFVIEWARAAGGVQGKVIRVAPGAVRAISTAEYPTPAKRPLNSRLDISKIQRVLDIRLPHWQFGVERMLAEISG